MLMIMENMNVTSYVLMFIMCSVLLLINIVTQHHKKELKESFNEQTRFSKKLLELEEEEEEEDIDDDHTDNELPSISPKACDCKTTKMTILEVDEIKPDQTTAVEFVDDVKMNNNAEVAGTLTIKGTQFATFDAVSNKLIIG